MGMTQEKLINSMKIGSASPLDIRQQKDLEQEAPAMPLCWDIIEGKSYLEKGTKSTDPVGEIPTELKQAIKSFFISTALRNLRGQRNKPNIMLIHIVRFAAQQNKIKRKVAEYVKEEIENLVLYGDADIEASFRELWEEDYQQTLKYKMVFLNIGSKQQYLSEQRYIRKLSDFFQKKSLLFTVLMVKEWIHLCIRIMQGSRLMKLLLAEISFHEVLHWKALLLAILQGAQIPMIP